MPRQASALACQDVRVEFDGKLTIVGVFTTNMTIPSAPFIVPQLGIIFTVEGDVDEPLRSISFEVLLPGASTPSRLDIPPEALSKSSPPLEGQKRWKLLIPMAIAPAVLSPGRIVCKIKHDKGEIETAAGWVALASPIVGAL